MDVTDSPHAGLAPPVNDLVVTVRAPALALARPDGQIRAQGMDGLFVGDVRALTEVRLRFGGTEPHPLATLAEGPGRTRFVAVALGFGDPINDPTVRLERVRELHADGMSERLVISSTASRRVRALVSIDLRCDLTPLDVARHGGSHPDLPAALAGDGLFWHGAEHTVTVHGEGAVLSAEPARLHWDVDLPSGGQTTLRWRFAVTDDRPVLAAPAGPVEWSRPEVRADDTRLPRLLARALDDLESLRLTEPPTPDGEQGSTALAASPGTFLAAGAPWFLTLFGRDSIWAARMLLPLGTALAEGTLRTLARRQGSTVDPLTGEAPGKIMHELRRHDGRLPTAAATPGGVRPAYYGTVDATLLWISLLADAWRWGMPETVVAELRPHLHRALGWLADHADPDGDGFIEYIDEMGAGLANQGWKDSFNAVRFRDGSLGRPPIALCEVQGYAHRAALDAAVLLEALDAGAGEVARWRDYAAGMAERFRARFWVDGPLGPYPALAIDGDGRPVDALTSNIGHLLGTGLLNGAEQTQVAGLLAAAPLAGGYGLRTMSTMDAGFAPLSYHCGSVWPHDTAIALLGLTAVGASEAAAGLVDGLLRAAEAFDYRLPELYGGDDRTPEGRPVPYPGACRPQAWAAAAAVTVLQAGLGLRVDVPNGEVHVRPLPGIGAIDVAGLRIAGRPVRITVDRNGASQISGTLPVQRSGSPVER